ncbi:MAG TPA: type II secretion system F family protein [Xanthobacteraceae bacterium]|jgi:tight adherence protein B|nr:type II secretion system F family protein [Xanthobacteraceae bacterium]
MPLQTLAMFFLGTLAAGGVVWVFVYPLLSGERRADQRKASVARSEPAGVTPVARGVPKARREQVEETLKEIEVRNKHAKSPPLSARIAQAGLSWSKRQFMMISAGLALVAFVAGLGVGGGIVPAVAMAFAAGLGLPRWILIFLKRRRERRFIDGFADAVDVIVRGVKAGLPLGDCLKIVANDAAEPVRSEFRAVVETQTIGMPLGDACGRLYESVPLPEANFFGIVISIQQKAGGNLSEALGNLSRVLRDRKKMQAKIRAMSMEAKASAVIIGSLPIAVMTLVYITSPNYIELLWTTELGRLMMASCVVWMSIGVFVMKKMINFDF